MFVLVLHYFYIIFFYAQIKIRPKSCRSVLEFGTI